MRFRFISEDTEEYVGFIAEEVPDLVASQDRTSLSAMDIAAVLTEVVKQQQGVIQDLEARVADLERSAKIKPISAQAAGCTEQPLTIINLP